MLERVLYVFLWTVPVFWVVVGWWTWRMVRRNELRDAPLLMRRIPVLGIGICGLGMWLYVAITQAWMEAGNVPFAQALGIGRFWKELALTLAIGYPLWMWGDFLFRRGVMWFMKFEGRRAPPPPSTPAK